MHAGLRDGNEGSKPMWSGTGGDGSGLENPEGGGARSGHAGVLGGSNGPKDKKSRAGSEELSWVTP